MSAHVRLADSADNQDVEAPGFAGGPLPQPSTFPSGSDVPEASNATNPLRLSPLVYCLIFLTAIPVLFIIFNDFLNVFILPIIFAAPVLLFYLCWWRKAKQHTTLDWISRMFFVGACPGVCCALVVELVVQVVLVVVIFGNDKDAIEAAGNASSTDPAKQEQALQTLRHSARFIVFLLLMAFAVAATVEETVKLAAVRVAPIWRLVCVEWDLRAANPYATILFIVAAAAGFSTIENLEYTFGASLAGGAAGFGARFLLALVRVFVSFPVHVICAGLTGVQLVRREYSPSPGLLPAVLLPAILLHGSFDAAAMLLPVLVTNAVAATAATAVVCLVLVAAGAVVLRRRLIALDLPDKYNQYLQRVQHGIYAVRYTSGGPAPSVQMGTVVGVPTGSHAQQGVPPHNPYGHAVQGYPVAGAAPSAHAQWTAVAAPSPYAQWAPVTGTVAQPPTAGPSSYAPQPANTGNPPPAQ